MSMVIILFQYNYERNTIFNTINIFTMDRTNNSSITILTSEQIQMIMDEWYDKLDIQTKYDH